MTENKAQLSNWIKDIVAFHKAKRKFVSLKEMESDIRTLVSVPIQELDKIILSPSVKLNHVFNKERCLTVFFANYICDSHY
jgi:hypothetical protein